MSDAWTQTSVLQQGSDVIISILIIALLFIIVLETLSREFRSGVPWENLYDEDLVNITESLEECVRRLLSCKEAMEKKGLRVNAGKFVCVEVLRPSQPNGVMSSAVSLPNHTFTGQA